jgi:transcriptional regulator with XRE-family HTH domain
VARNVAERIRAARTARRWSAQRLAAECASGGMPSLTRSTIAKIESGVRQSITADELVVLARALEVSPESLMSPAVPGEPRPAPRSRDEDDPRSPLFFLSYAQSSLTKRQGDRERRRNWRFVRFFEDLSENVAELVSRPAGSDPGYMDSSVADGKHWTAELLHAVGTCQVFVALLSPIYFDSHWSGVEWNAFARRQVISYPEGEITSQTAIIPVFWTPVREWEIPKVVRETQFFYPEAMPDSDKAVRYESDGVVGLLQLDDNAYQAVVWRLAQRIAEIHYTHRVEPRSFQIDELQNAFKE